MAHSSTESEIISLDAGLRMDGIPALDLLDVVIEVLPASDTNNPKEFSKRRQSQEVAGNCSTHIQRKIEERR